MHADLVDDWKLTSMTKETNNLWDPEVKHWKCRFKTMKKYDKMVRVSTHHLTHFEEIKEKLLLHFQKKQGPREEKHFRRNQKCQSTAMALKRRASNVNFLMVDLRCLPKLRDKYF